MDTTKKKLCKQKGNKTSEIRKYAEKDSNLFNNLLGLPERPDLVKIKEHFKEQITEKES